MWKPLGMLIFSFCLAGCGSSFITPRGLNPVIQDRVGFTGDIGIIATTASRRAIAFRDVPPDSELAKQISVEFCPEPPPDAIDEIIREFTAQLAGSFGSTQIDSAQIRSFISATGELLFQRSQGVQMFRDGMYNICILHMNRMLTKEETDETVKALIQQTADLIRVEIEQGRVIGGAVLDDESPTPQTAASTGP